MSAGVRQGCPASMVLFALALDPFVRWVMSEALGPGDSLRAYADDLGMVMADVISQLPVVMECFNTYTLEDDLAPSRACGSTS